MPPVSDEARQRLADMAKRRRAELGLALNDANAQAAGTSKGTWARVEKALKIHDKNLTKIDDLLQWARGSCLTVLEGGEPTPIEEMKDSDAAGTQKSRLSPEAAGERARDVIQLALLATATGTTAEEIREMSERAARDLREAGLI